MDEPVLALELFDLIDEYVDATTVADAVKGPLDEDAELLEFCRSALDQALAGLGVEITGFGLENQTRVNKALEAGRGSRPEHELALLRRYLHFAREYEDLLGGTYGDSSDGSWWLHREFLYKLLADLIEWLVKRDDEELVERASLALSRYAAFEQEREG